jgi:hypothetical protein
MLGISSRYTVTVSAAKEKVQDASLLTELTTDRDDKTRKELSIPQPDRQETFVTAML